MTGFRSAPGAARPGQASPGVPDLAAPVTPPSGPSAPLVSAWLPAELWYWNGLALQDANGSWNIASLGGSRFGVPVFRGQNYLVPYRAGQNFRQKFPDARTITLAMWTDGQGTRSGYPAADQRLAWNNNLAQLRQALFAPGAAGSRSGQLQRTWYLTRGGISQLVAATAMADLAGSMDVTMNGRTNAAFSADFLLSDPHFYATSPQVVACSGASTTVTGLGEGVAGLGYPSAVAGFTVTLTAACTVINVTAGVSFTFSGSSGFPVTVDVLAGTVTDSGGGNQIGALAHSGARAWMVVLPGSNAISVSAGTATFRFNDAYI
jgi:hypothetical protein